jgi:hypothetical protein
MKVYALVGKSGTGKSYQAMNICKEKNMDAIVDDGLLIHGNAVAAGTSAKRQSTKIGAIKTALFTDEDHRKEVRDKIRELDIQSILLLGTSRGMVEKNRLPPGIAGNLRNHLHRRSDHRSRTNRSPQTAA